MEAERGAAHSWTQRFGCDDRILDRRCGRKDAGEERVQRTAIIGVIACASASVRIRASVVTMAIGLMPISMVGAGLVVTGMGDGGAGSRVGWPKRRRDDTGKLGDQKEGDQNPNHVRLCPEPLHDSSGCSGKQERLWADRPRASIPYVPPRRIRANGFANRPKSGPAWFLCGALVAPLPTPAFLV